jgi:DNA-binding response OmpR family regulator
MSDPIKILYAEDEPFLGKIVRESLQSRGFQVELVADGGAVLDAFAALRPDICVLDVMLPQRDGFSIGRDIRRLSPRLPIIYLTAKSQTEDVVAGFAAGGNDYLRKPFSMEELIVRIQNLLALAGRPETAAPPAGPEADPETKIRLGAYHFYPLRQELQWEDQVRRLSHRETELLLMLTEKPHQPIARKDILERLWGNDSFFNSRNLDVYIARLRDYLRNDDSVQIITLKGVGYRVIGL